MHESVRFLFEKDEKVIVGGRLRYGEIKFFEHTKIVSIVFRKFSFILNRLNCNVPVKPLHVKGACTELALDAAREHRYHQAGGK